jgi:hypothetical protein
MRFAALFLFFILLPFQLLAQLQGAVYDAITSQPISQVLINTAREQTFSNDSGIFSLSAATTPTQIQIKISHSLYQDTTFTLGKETKLIVYLKPKYIALQEVEITAASNISRLGTETTRLGRRELENITKPLGEADLNKALQLKPGVLQTGETQSGLFIRGGNNAQTAVLLQGVPIFNAAHLLGLNSSLDPDAYELVTLTTGGFPARDGGWLSAYLQTEPRSESIEQNQLKLGVGILSSEASYERQLPKLKTSVFLKAKSSYYQLLAKAYRQLHPKEDDVNSLPDYAFSDLNLQTNSQFLKGTLSLAFFGSQDEYDGTTDRFSLASRWGNRMFSTRWKKSFGSSFLEVTQGYSRYTFSMEHSRQEKDLVDQATSGYFSTILVRMPFGSTGYLEAGTFLQHLQAKVFASQQDDGNRLLQKKEQLEKLMLGGLFSEAQFGIAQFTLTAGARLYRHDQQLMLAPRLKAQFQDAGWATSLYYDRTYQFHHQVNILGVNMPFDFIRFASGNLPVQMSDQVGLSFNGQVQNHTVKAGLYHRWQEGQLFYSNGTALLKDFDIKFDSHTGRAYGLEVEYQASFDKISLNTGYTLAFSKIALGTDNGGKRWVYPVQDVRHQINTGLQYSFAKHWVLTGQWFLQTGSPYTFPLSIIPVQGMTPGTNLRLIPNFQQFNNVRTPLRHRLDLSLTHKKRRQKSTSEWNFGVYNLYNQANPYFLYFDVSNQEDGTGKIVAKQRSLLPFTPTIRYTCSFDL